MKNSKKIMGAAGAAAAATAVGIAAATIKNRKPTVLHVKPSDDAWVLAVEGKDGTSYDTKRAAVQAGRELADSKAPSRLVIHRRDGTIQKQHSYEKDR